MSRKKKLVFKGRSRSGGQFVDNSASSMNSSQEIQRVLKVAGCSTNTELEGP